VIESSEMLCVWDASGNSQLETREKDFFFRSGGRGRMSGSGGGGGKGAMVREKADETSLKDFVRRAVCTIGDGAVFGRPVMERSSSSEDLRSGIGPSDLA